jgi:hypothetical protein
MEITPFQSGQIVSLDHGDRKLYAEVIQVVVSRQLCWVRPLLLVTFTQEPPLLTDLRDASDLLWSVDLFHPALDTEVIHFFTEILAKEPKPGQTSFAKQQLNHFIQQIWQVQNEGRE